MPSNREMLLLGLRRLMYTLLLMFLGPAVLYQAFKNAGHPMFIPVVVIGAIFALGAVAMGFYAIKTLVDGFFGKGR